MKWTKDRLAQLEAMWPTHTVTEIAHKLKTNRGRVYLKAEEIGLSLKTRPPSDRKAWLAELVADGMTIPEARQQMGISQQRASQLWLGIRNDLGWQAQ